MSAQENRFAYRPKYPKPAYAWYVLVILTLAYMSSFIDRMILNLLVDPIRRDMQITDTQMSLLMGFSFALFYTLFGLPLGRMADTTSRRRIIAFGIVVWSAMTAVCGLVKNYSQFLLARVGVGVGEAALSPAAYSMISDYFPKERLGLAMSVYALGIYLGNGLALLLGGLSVHLAGVRDVWTLPLVGTIFPWQMVFFIVGIPGLFVALLMLTVKEPVRREVAGSRCAPLSAVKTYIKANARTFLCHNVGFALLTLAAFAFVGWTPTCLIRKFGLTAVQAAVALGICMTVFATLGSLFGGWLADRYAARNANGSRMRVALIAALGVLPCMAAFPFMPTAAWTIATLVPVAVFLGMPFGVAVAAIQDISPARMRGQLSALYLFAINLIGLGIGPTAVALLTDYVFADDLAVPYSVSITMVVAAASAAVLFKSSFGAYERSVQYAGRWSAVDAPSASHKAGADTIGTNPAQV
jgi:MFS family permease